MASKDKSESSLQLEHPMAGTSRADFSIVAVRWRSDAAAEAKRTLLDELGLSLYQLEGSKPLVAVNQTDGLSWVCTSNNTPLDAKAIERLERSDLVQWVMPALRPEGAKAQAISMEPTPPASALYTINPTRFYVRESAIDRVGGAAALAPGLTTDINRPGRLRGYTTVRVDAPSFASGRTALHFAPMAAQAVGVAASMAGRSDVKFETIPLLSPAMHALQLPAAAPQRVPGCRPPQGEFTPGDPMFAQQWGLQRVGAPRGWEIVRGSPAITVAVIDEGVQLDHPDLDLHPQSWNASDDVADGSPTGNHGTACAGIIGARIDNAQGVAGIAGGCRIMAIATATWADVDIAEGLYFAADNGARIVSMSFGVYASWNFWDFDLIRDALQYAHDRGLVLIAASGNENGPQARFPGSDSRTLCVGGSNRSDERKRIGDSSSENWWGASFGPDVDVVAPCLEMPTTDRLGGSGYSAGDYYDRFNGTSSATPLVAGMAALLLSLRPTLSNTDVRRIIEGTCDKVSPALYAYQNVPTKPSGTWNNEVGYGRVNLERALLAACQEAEDCGCADECSGCGNTCEEKTPEFCRGPKHVPWLPSDRCMYFYESRVFDGKGGDGAQQRLRLRVSYQHCLRLIGRQQGPLLYTTTLLPMEQVRLFEYDRYRRTKSATQRVSVHTSFRQTVSALSQNRRSTASSSYFDTLNEIRTHADGSVSVGGGLAGLFGAPSGKFESGIDTETTVASGGSVRTASEQFSQFALMASQAVEAERSLTVSSFEDQEHVSTTARTLKNDNDCYAVTYYVRRVNEVYEMHSRIDSVEWRLGEGMAWRSIDDLAGLPDGLRKQVNELVRELLRHGQEHNEERQLTLPTDGTVYEAELAHCASCDPMHLAKAKIQVEQLRLQARRACLETELLELEVARRRALAQSPQPVELPLGMWPLGLPAPTPLHELEMHRMLALPNASTAMQPAMPAALQMATPVALPAPDVTKLAG
jgi:subtilisin family serine protease